MDRDIQPDSGKDIVPVLICGGGPVGLALAAELGFQKIHCVLVEQGDGSVPVPKMSQLTTRTLEFCRRWGIAEQVKQAGWPERHPGDFVYVTSLTGYELYRQRYPSYAERAELSFSPEGPRHCPQIFFDPVLLNHVASLSSVTLKHRTRFDGFSEEADAIAVETTDLASGKTQTIRARYLVGCDGFDGSIRKALGTEYEGEGVLSFSVSIFFRSRELSVLHDKGWARFFRLIDVGGHWGDLVSIDGKELWRMTELRGDADADVGSFDVEGCLRKAVGRDFSYEVLSVLPWKRRGLVAKCYGRGRVFLAGDSVHQSSPTSGLGMNTGLGDAVDLGWKLGATIEGWGGERLLESYGIERMPVGAVSVADSDRTYYETTLLSGGSAIAADSAEGQRQRRYFVENLLKVSRGKGDPTSENIKLGYCYEPSPIVVSDGTPGPPEDAWDFVPSARPGTRAPHAWLEKGKSTLDLFGRGFTLLRFGGPVPEAIVRAAAARGVPLRMVDISNPDIAKLYERKLVLVRPDGHVAWRGDDCPVDATALIDTVRGHFN
ncbi:MAG TPA: FAD-dependent monooxygenase [Candidatus Binatia bacterium]|jgi:2-polyprenyl-6-methoxyphenol hydroxylase-like FAD-dependent oxidoreductase